jgi:hypothetical protein
MRKSSNITLNLTDIIKGSYPTHEGRVGDFGVSLVDIVLDKIGGEELFPNFKIDAWNLNRYGQRVEVKYSWVDRPKIDIEHMETVVLEIMEKIYDSRKDFNNHRLLESEIRDVIVDNFEPVED